MVPDREGGQVSKSSARELLDSLHANCPVAGCPSCELVSRVERVLALHNSSMTGLPASAIPRCADCKQEWPCPTVRLLDGEEP